MIPSLAVCGSVPDLLLVEHKLPVGIKLRHHGPGTGNPCIEVNPHPGAYGRVDVQTTRAELELILDDGRDGFFQAHHSHGLGSIAAEPCLLPGTVRQPCDHGLVPLGIYRCQIRVVVVKPVSKSQFLDFARILLLAFIATLARGRKGAEGKTFSAIPPGSLMVKYYYLLDPVAGCLLPVGIVGLPFMHIVIAGQVPGSLTAPGRRGIGNCRQNLFKTG